MKQCILRRALSALLCLVLALSLTACGGGTEPPETEGGSSMTGALSGGKGNVSEPKDDPDDPEKAEAGLVLLRACMAEDDQLAGAVAYLGQREPNDRSSMTDWLLENSGDLVSELPFLLEIPAGKLDAPDEDPLEAAQRELREETGATAAEWHTLGLFCPVGAYSTERIQMYLARGLTFGERELDEDEFLNVFRMPLDELVDKVLAGEIPDAKTQAAALRAKMMLERGLI